MAKHSEFVWAIETNAENGASFITQEYFGHQMPPFSAGITLATFGTREIARKHLPEVKTWFPHAKVVKLKVALSVQQKMGLENAGKKG
jgi:hypothetical protein